MADPDPIVRQNAVDEIDHIEGRWAIQQLGRMVDDPDPDVRMAVATALENLGSASR